MSPGRWSAEQSVVMFSLARSTTRSSKMDAVSSGQSGVGGGGRHRKANTNKAGLESGRIHTVDGVSLVLEGIRARSNRKIGILLLCVLSF